MIGGRDISKARVDNEWPSARQPRPLSSSESSISNGSIYVTGVIEFMPVKGGWRRLEMRTAKCVHSVRVQHSLSACTSPYDGSRCVLRPSFARNSIFDACRVSFSMTLACPAEFDNHPSNHSVDRLSIAIFFPFFPFPSIYKVSLFGLFSSRILRFGRSNGYWM